MACQPSLPVRRKILQIPGGKNLFATEIELFLKKYMLKHCNKRLYLLQMINFFCMLSPKLIEILHLFFEFRLFV